MTNQKIWAMSASTSRSLSLSPEDLRFFDKHFIGEPLAERWSGPPNYNILGKSYPANDFVAWFLSAPVVSPKVASFIEGSCGSTIEILDFGRIKKETYSAINVLKVVDLLEIADLSKSNLKNIPGTNTSIPKGLAVKEDISILPNIFMISGLIPQVYVSNSFAQELSKRNFSGLLLGDASLDLWSRSIFEGERNDWAS